MSAHFLLTSASVDPPSPLPNNSSYSSGSVLYITNSTFSSNVVFYPPFPINSKPHSGYGGGFAMAVAGPATNTTTVQTQLTFLINTTAVATVYYDILGLNTSVQAHTKQTLVPFPGNSDLAILTLTQQWNCDNSLQSYLLQLITKEEKIKNSTQDAFVNYIIDPYVSACYNPNHWSGNAGFSTVQPTNPSAAFVSGFDADSNTWTGYFSSNTSSLLGTGFLVSYPSSSGYLVYQNDLTSQLQLLGGSRQAGTDVVQFQTPIVSSTVPQGPPSPQSCDSYASFTYRITNQPIQGGGFYRDITLSLYDWYCYQWRKNPIISSSSSFSSSSSSSTGSSSSSSGPNPDDDSGDHPKKIVIIGLIIAIALVVLAVVIGCVIKRSSGSSSGGYVSQV